MLTSEALPRFEGGIYENVFARDSVDEPWKIKVLNYHPCWHGTYEDGWAHTPAEYVPFPKVLFPEDPSGPDEVLPADEIFLWPDTHTMPFHYAHPVTGEAVPSKSDMRAMSVADGAAQQAEKSASANGKSNGVANGH